MSVVCDSSALMHLGAIGHLDLLRELFSEIHIPEEVYQEVAGQGAGKPGADEVTEAGWIKRHTISSTPAVLAMRLHRCVRRTACRESSTRARGCGGASDAPVGGASDASEVLVGEPVAAWNVKRQT